MPILQTRKRKFNLLEIEWFADYIDTGAGIQTYNVLLQNPGLFPLYHTASQKQRKKKEWIYQSYVVEKREQRGTAVIFAIFLTFF